ncbi:RNA-directed DNA polymerase, eukaryota, reverse transcriptase zinc-binding domain protein [Tanacetum coccineum]
MEKGQYGNANRQWNAGNPRVNIRRPNVRRYEYRKRMEEATNVKETNNGDNIEKEDNNIQNKTNTKKSKNGNNNLKEDELRGKSKSNRFTLLNELVEEEELVPSVNEREVVDNFIKNRINPTKKDMENWNSPMIRYFKDRKEIIDVIDNMEEMDSDDVLDEVNGNEKSCLRNEVDGGGGLSTSDKQKEIQKLINEEKIQLMVVLETHIKYKNVKKVCDKIFGNWGYCTNSANDNKGCRIMIGWDNNSVNVWVIGQSKQYMFLLVESLNRKTKFFDTVVYAMSGDFNVTLNVSEHSSGSSSSSNDMKEFYECINDVKLEDINSSGLITKYPDIHGCFLPFLISNHSPAILIMRNGIAKNKRAFRFSNFIAKRENFHQTVKEVWKQELQGYNMYRLVKKLKGLKGPLNKMSWKKGDVSDRVIRCRDDLKNIQSAMEKDLDNADLRNKSCELLNEYNIAKKEEESMLFQKARVEWLSKGDRNTSFFHKILKERRHKSKIMAICDENGTRCENEEVAGHFLKHFKDFLGKKDKFETMDGLIDIFDKNYQWKTPMK